MQDAGRLAFTFETAPDYRYPLALIDGNRMERLIERKIVAEARKRLAKHSQNAFYAHRYREVYQKRTGEKARRPKIPTPNSWDFDKHFDPRYCINHASFIARGVWNSLQLGLYEPKPALRHKSPKPDGGTRNIDAFSIPDAVIALIFIKNLRQRNAKIFSDSSFAYQERKTPLDAVLKVREMLGAEKIFISQYDFSKFFDSISHKHIELLLEEDSPFQTTHMERQIIGAILTHEYSSDGVVERRTTGTPQGNSMSLFISNLAAHTLDMELSKISGSFARFADDSVVVNFSYEDALKCAETYREFSQKSGIKINEKKSTGIRILSEVQSEMRHITEFTFLSYKFTPKSVFVSDKSIRTIKARCAKIIYMHLLLHPRRAKKISLKRVGRGFYDWDLVTCINELRNYIYGKLKQGTIDLYLDGNINLKNIQGAVSYFSLVESGEQFRALDGWLIDILHRALSERAKIISSTTTKKRHVVVPKDMLIDGSWYTRTVPKLETQAPSFFTAWRASRKSLARHGLGGVDGFGMGYTYK
jgi:RNA-directed DNA polymerase